jgi:ABC-2 type transport system ATP-binding protein
MSELQDMADHLVIVGRGKVIADTSTRELLAAVSGDRVRLRTGAAPEATAVLAPAGAAVTADGTGTLTVAGLTAGQVVALLSAKAVPFSEVSAHHATLEQAYLELTRNAAEYRAADAVGRHAGPAGHGAPRSRGSSAATGQEVAR